MTIALTRDLFESLLAEAAEAAPEECCGLLLGEGDRIADIRAAANVADDPLTRFEIDPQALVDAFRAQRAGGPQVVGYYHSHPVGRAEPSPCDQQHAAGDGAVWVIMAGGEVRFWRDGKDGFTALSYRCAEA